MDRRGLGRTPQDSDRGTAQKADGDDARLHCEAVEDGMSAHGGKLPEENHQ
jgi:hypothetical protein